MSSLNTRTQIGLVVGGLIAAAVIVLFALNPNSSEQTATATIAGDPLPAMSDTGVDAAVGLDAPGVTGSDFDDAVVAINPGHSPTAVMFVAHWCPHCQAEVTAVQEWLDGGNAIPGIQMVTVSTAVDPERDNYPPSSWLEDESWQLPVIRDTEDSNVYQTFGGTTFPYWVLIDADGTVAQRISGSVEMTDLVTALRTIAP